MACSTPAPPGSPCLGPPLLSPAAGSSVYPSFSTKRHNFAWHAPLPRASWEVHMQMPVSVRICGSRGTQGSPPALAAVEEAGSRQVRGLLQGQAVRGGECGSKAHQRTNNRNNASVQMAQWCPMQTTDPLETPPTPGTGRRGPTEDSSEAHSGNCCGSRIPARQVVGWAAGIAAHLETVRVPTSRHLRVSQLSMCEVLGAMPGAE